MTSRKAATELAKRLRPRQAALAVRPQPLRPSGYHQRFAQRNPSPLPLQQAQQRQIHFLPLLGVWGAKHVSAWTLYNAGRNYGWPRVYRRLLEHNRHFNRGNPALQAQTQRLIRMGLEAPVQFAAQIADQSKVILPFLNKVVERATPNLPSFLVTWAKYILNSQKPVKILQDLASSAAKRAPSK